MSEVDADHLASPEVDHEVGEVAVTDSQQVLADTDHCMRSHKHAAQNVECFRRRAHLVERSPVKQQPGQ